MIKRLRIKFVCVIMIIVMVLLGCILGMVIHFTGQHMEMQSINMMRTIAATPFQQGIPEKPMDNEVRLPFLIVQINSRGDMITVNGSYFDLTDRAHLQEIVNKALLSDQESGKLDDHELRYLKSASPMGLTIIFSDTTTESTTMKHLLYNCFAVFFFAMIVFFYISILLSNWVIQPVATAWDLQRQFVADASHELKTPLSVIMANAELMQNAETTEEEKLTFSENILSTTYQMRSLVENMLEMARVDDSTVIMNFEQIDLSQLVNDATLSFQLLYEEKGLGLRCAAPGNVEIHGSEQHLYQVLDVLLDNALKYSTPGGMVNVDLISTGKHCVLSVESTGEPISKEDLKNIFKRFYRTDKARAMNGSYGLGLAIAESIVETHRGKMWAESEQGQNTFFVQLPLK